MRLAELKQLSKKNLICELLKQKQEINELKKEVTKQSYKWMKYYRGRDWRKNNA